MEGVALAIRKVGASSPRAASQPSLVWFIFPLDISLNVSVKCLLDQNCKHLSVMSFGIVLSMLQFHRI